VPVAALSSSSVTPAAGFLVALARATIDALPAAASQALRADVATALGLQPGAVFITSLYNGQRGVLTAYDVSQLRRLQGGGASSPAFPPGFAFPASLAPLAAYSQQAVTVVGVVAATGLLGALPALAARLRSPGGVAFAALTAALSASVPGVACAVDGGSIVSLALSSAAMPGPLSASASPGPGVAPAAAPATAAPATLSPGEIASITIGVVLVFVLTCWCMRSRAGPDVGVVLRTAYTSKS
jgi:hypothetical protein